LRLLVALFGQLLFHPSLSSRLDQVTITIRVVLFWHNASMQMFTFSDLGSGLLLGDCLSLKNRLLSGEFLFILRTFPESEGMERTNFTAVQIRVALADLLIAPALAVNT
jgi:hypothetical protein